MDHPFESISSKQNMESEYFDNLRFDLLCKKIIELDKNIEMIAILNKKGRPIEIKIKEGATLDLSAVKKEMFFMQSVLQISMNKEHDEEFGRVKSIISEREKFTIFSFEFFNYVILVVSESITYPLHLKNSILEKLVNSKKIELIQ